jgi:hypothetical protein
MEGASTAMDRRTNIGVTKKSTSVGKFAEELDLRDPMLAYVTLSAE